MEETAERPPPSPSRRAAQEGDVQDNGCNGRTLLGAEAAVGPVEAGLVVTATHASGDHRDMMGLLMMQSGILQRCICGHFLDIKP